MRLMFDLARWLLLVIASLSAFVPSAAGEEKVVHPTYVLVVDESRSLRTTDPAGVRQEALALLTELMLPRDGLWVIGFGGRSRDISGGPRLVLDRGEAGHLSRTQAQAVVRKLTDEQDWTNYAAPLETIATELATWDQDRLLRSPPVVFFLTDGKLSLPKEHRPENHKDTAHIVGLVRDLRDRGVAVHFVGLGDFERTLLEEMADAAGRPPIYIPRADGLIAAFWSLVAEYQGLSVLARSGPQTAVGEVELGARVHGKAARLYALLTGPEIRSSPIIWTGDAQGYRCGGANQPTRCAAGPRYFLAEIKDPPAGPIQLVTEAAAGQEAVLLQQGGITWRATSEQAELFPGVEAEVRVFAMAGGDTVRPRDAAFLRDATLGATLEGKRFVDDDTVRGAVAQDGVILARALVREVGPTPLTVSVSSSGMEEDVLVEGPSIERLAPLALTPASQVVEAFWPREHVARVEVHNSLTLTTLGARVEANPISIGLSDESVLVPPGESRVVSLELPRSDEPRAAELRVHVLYGGSPTAQVLHATVQWQSIGIMRWAQMNPFFLLLLLLVGLVLAWAVYKLVKPRPSLNGRYLEVRDPQRHRVASEELTPDHGREVRVLQGDDGVIVRVSSGTAKEICSIRLARRDKRRFEVLSGGRVLASARLGDEVSVGESWRVELV